MEVYKDGYSNGREGFMMGFILEGNIDWKGEGETTVNRIAEDREC